MQRKKQRPPSEHPAPTPRVDSVDDLAHAELSGTDDKTISLEASDTDEDEKEGSGDANMGRPLKTIL